MRISQLALHPNDSHAYIYALTVQYTIVMQYIYVIMAL